jgi:hypothetical protein
MPCVGLDVDGDVAVCRCLCWSGLVDLVRDVVPVYGGVIVRGEMMLTLTGEGLRCDNARNLALRTARADIAHAGRLPLVDNSSLPRRGGVLAGLPPSVWSTSIVLSIEVMLRRVFSSMQASLRLRYTVGGAAAGTGNLK